MTNLFINPIESYKRDIDPLEGYLNQSAFYVSKMLDLSLEEARVYVRDKNNENIKNPTVEYYHRKENKDVEKSKIGLKQYIDNVVTNEEILAPTFTSYMNPKKEVSMLVGFLEQNISLRSKAKKLAFKYKSEGRHKDFGIKHNEQANYKLYNNSLSGTFCSDGTTLLNPTAHSTLTSTVRVMSSISNANNEKFIEGNRHYYNIDVTLANVIYLSSIANEELTTIMAEYNIHHPTVDETMECIHRSTKLYWKDEVGSKTIREFVSKLDPIERAAIVYLGDLYHLRLYNDLLVRNMLTEISCKYALDGVDIPTMLDVIDGSDELMISLAHVICMDEVRGKGMNHKDMDLDTIRCLYGTIIHIKESLQKYNNLLHAFFTTPSIPNNVSRIKHMIRRCVVLSDTDSTVFSTDNWILWYFGNLDFTPKGFAIANTLGFLTTMIIKHSIRIFSANVGVPNDKKDILSMKPEYNFPVFAQALVSKHYYTSILIQEGNVWNEPTLEIKGSLLKASMAPKNITADTHKQMSNILNTVIKGKKISIQDELDHLISIETKIYDELIKGKSTYFSLSKIKSPEGYSDDNPAKTPYLQHMLWMDVFQDKYGTIDPPPYGCVKIPTILINKTSLSKWVASIEDSEFRNRVIGWLTKHKKTTLPTIYINVDFINAFNIPIEILNIINTTKIILDITRANRMLLETLGYFVKPNILLKDLNS